MWNWLSCAGFELMQVELLFGLFYDVQGCSWFCWAYCSLSVVYGCLQGIGVGNCKVLFCYWCAYKFVASYSHELLPCCFHGLLWFMLVVWLHCCRFDAGLRMQVVELFGEACCWSHGLLPNKFALAGLLSCIAGYYGKLNLCMAWCYLLHIGVNWYMAMAQ